MIERPIAPPTGAPAAGGKLNSIQYVRAIAASVVVLSHAANSLLGHAAHLINLDYGAYGVDIFFVVSGFVMYYTTFATGIRPSAFFLKRLIRIFPLYFVLSTLMFALVLASPASFNKESPDVRAYVESIFFIPHWNPRFHELQPLIGPGWTLNNEMFFYLLFAASLFLGSRLNALAVLLVICTLIVSGWLHPIENPLYITYTSPLMLEFCLGIIVAAVFIYPRKPSLRWPIALVTLLGAGTVYLYAFHVDSYGSELLRPLFVGLPCALVVAALVATERCGKLPTFAFLALLGDASYSLYLGHSFVLGFAQHFWQRFVGINSVLAHALFIVLVLGASVVLALILYRHLELKVGRALSAALRQRQQRRAPLRAS
jgi:exopolysaccharide production protein ExoZ